MDGHVPTRYLSSQPAGNITRRVLNERQSTSLQVRGPTFDLQGLLPPVGCRVEASSQIMN